MNTKLTWGSALQPLRHALRSSLRDALWVDKKQRELLRNISPESGQTPAPRRVGSNINNTIDKGESYRSSV